MADVLPAEPPGSVAGLLSLHPGYSGVQRILKTVRRHMGMSVAFLSRFRERDRVLEHVDSDGDTPLHAGDVIPLNVGLCQRIVRGELPGVIPDLSKLPGLQPTSPLESLIRAHLSVPVMLDGGELYGTLCCFSYRAEPALGPRDLQMMQGFAEVLADRIGESLGAERLLAANVAQIQSMMAAGDPSIAFQPIYQLSTERMAGVECLSRFQTEPVRPPNEWFALAHSAGLGQDLELLAIAKALKLIDRFPPEVFVCVNSSPDVILAGKLDMLLQETDVTRVVLEITEHSIVADYQPLADALRPLRQRGLHLAIDDAGAGYASMRHILNLLPDIIKLDMSLTRNIDNDPHRRALARALIHFAQDIGSRITAEGVETAAEMEMLRSLGVDQAQGYFLGRPGSLEDALRLLA